MPNCASISPPFLKYEKIGKVLVVGDFVARIETYDNVMVLDLTCDLEDCTISNYGRLLIHMLKCTNLHISQWYPCVSVDKCFHMSSSLRRRKYSWLYIGELEWDASLLNIFSISPLSHDSHHKPLYLHIATKNSHIDLCIRVQMEKRYIMWPRYSRHSVKCELWTQK